MQNQPTELDKNDANYDAWIDATNCNLYRIDAIEESMEEKKSDGEWEWESRRRWASIHEKLRKKDISNNEDGSPVTKISSMTTIISFVYNCYGVHIYNYDNWNGEFQI